MVGSGLLVGYLPEMLLPLIPHSGASQGKGKHKHTDNFPKKTDFRKLLASKPGVKAHSSNPGTQEAEAGALKV